MIEVSSNKQKKIKGIWFFGLAGAGKTFASQICASIIPMSFVIDGDDVRKLISFDLDYSPPNRAIQVKRVLGLAEIVIKNSQIPIVSSVTMSEEVFDRCSYLGFKIAKINRPMEQLREIRKIYDSDTQVVGKDIQQKEFDVIKLYNNGDQNFLGAIKDFVK